MQHKQVNQIVFHGSNARFFEFTEKAKRIQNDFFGGGIGYFTDTEALAESYAKGMQKRYGGFQFVYRVQIRLKNCFDVDQIYGGPEFLKILQASRFTPEQFARRAGLLIMGSDKFRVIGDIKTGRISLTGEQVWKGLSETRETTKAQDILKKCGYDGLRYNGGINMNAATRHSVFCPYYADSIKIVDVEEHNQEAARPFVGKQPILS